MSCPTQGETQLSLKVVMTCFLWAEAVSGRPGARGENVWYKRHPGTQAVLPCRSRTCQKTSAGGIACSLCVSCDSISLAQNTNYTLYTTCPESGWHPCCEEKLSKLYHFPVKVTFYSPTHFTSKFLSGHLSLSSLKDTPFSYPISV